MSTIDTTLTSTLVDLAKMLKGAVVTLQLYEVTKPEGTQEEQEDALSDTCIELLKSKLLGMCSSVDEANKWIQKMGSSVSKQVKDLNEQLPVKTRGRRAGRKAVTAVNRIDLVDGVQINTTEGQDGEPAKSEEDKDHKEDPQPSLRCIDMCTDLNVSADEIENDDEKSSVTSNESANANRDSKSPSLKEDKSKKAVSNVIVINHRRRKSKAIKLADVIGRIISDKMVGEKLSEARSELLDWVGAKNNRQRDNLDENKLISKIYQVLSEKGMRIDDCLLATFVDQEVINSTL